MKTLCSVLVLLVVVSSCSGPDAPADFDYGKVENNRYVNSYFDFEMSLPPDWVVQTQEEMERITSVGKDLVAGDDQRMKAIIKASEVNTANLLAVYRHEYGAAVEFNPNIMLIAENIAHAPGIKSGKEYLFQSRRLLTQSQFQYDHLDEEFEKEQIGGADFYKMNAQINYGGLSIGQTYYSTIIKGFSFNVIISYSGETEKQALVNMVNSMTFRQ
jgi:hypothetical protein